MLLDAQSLLVTIALSPEGIAAQSEFLLALAAARAGKHTIFIPCEYEHFGGDHSELLRRLTRLGMDVRRSVLNRLCNAEPLATDVTRRAVRADQQVEWYIEGKPNCPLLQALARSTGVHFTEHIEQHRLRTRWLAHGMHLSLALLASESKQMQLNAQAEELAHEYWIDRVLLMLVEQVDARCPDLHDTYEYAQLQIKALLRYEQDPKAALRNLRRSQLLPFLRELKESILDPWSEIVQGGGVQLPPEALRLLHAIEVVLCDIARYSDYESYAARDMVLHQSLDTLASVAYRRMLQRVLPRSKVDVDARVITLEVALQLHRNELEGAD